MFRNTRHIHLVAIGGIGMSGIAEILLNLDFTVSGSDLHASGVTQRLEKLGARVHIGHDPQNVVGADVVVRSSAVTEANSEVTAARSLRIPVIRRAEMLAELMRLKYGIAIAGSHGKTTTTSLVASVLAEGGLDPTAIVGGQIKAMGTNAVLGAGDYLVAEADESDGTFLHLTPTIAVVTNIDYEHVDYYPDLDALRAAFDEFMQRVPFYGACVLCVDDPEVRALIPHLDRKTITYGLSPEAEVRADPGTIAEGGSGQEAVVWAFGRELGSISLLQRGRHNLQNSLAAVAVGLELGVPFDRIARGLAASQGVGRRCEERGQFGGVLVVDDYGHHPTEILATLEVAHSFERPVGVIFQPHRFSRTANFAPQFADALANADTVALLPVYAAGEDPMPGVDSAMIAALMADKGLTRVDVLPGPEAIENWLDREVETGGLVMTLGAGDIGRQVDGICRHLQNRQQGASSE
ncbi:MAG: UDP-N-acetylmuramate--L-alanine ligase [Gemmatimonadales bacterium]|nr:UDP-N-acetylmuramate--L-alanine ligase [Gemmatimonadales bacterium]